MADSDRTLYGASSADYAILSNGSPDLNAVFEVWDAIAGGAHIIDLQDIDHVPATNLHVDATDATFRFYGPEFYTGALWIEGSGGKRFEARPVGMPERLNDVEAGLVTEGQARVDGDDLAVQAAADFTTTALAEHSDVTLNPDPHVQYDRSFDAVTGAIWSGKRWVGPAFPTPAQGVAEGDLLDFTG